MVTRGILEVIDTDRDRGILTRREREYLLGRSDIEEGSQNERSIRQSIRKHIFNTILDFSIIRTQLEDRDVESVFSTELDGSSDDRDETVAIHDSIPDTIAFLSRSKPHPELFLDDIEEGLERAALDQGVSADISLSMEIEGDELENIRKRLMERGPQVVSLAEIEDLHLGGKFPEDISYPEVVAEKMDVEYTGEYESMVEEELEEGDECES